MADRWLITIEAWPHSTGNGQEADQKAAGPRKNDFVVRAEGTAAAIRTYNVDHVRLIEAARAFTNTAKEKT